MEKIISIEEVVELELGNTGAMYGSNARIGMFQTLRALSGYGYYGHPIIIAKDENILLSDTL